MIRPKKRKERKSKGTIAGTLLQQKTDSSSNPVGSDLGTWTLPTHRKKIYHTLSVQLYPLVGVGRWNPILECVEIMASSRTMLQYLGKIKPKRKCQEEALQLWQRQLAYLIKS